MITARIRLLPAGLAGWSRATLTWVMYYSEVVLEYFTALHYRGVACYKLSFASLTPFCLFSLISHFRSTTKQQKCLTNYHTASRYFGPYDSNTQNAWTDHPTYYLNRGHDYFDCRFCREHSNLRVQKGRICYSRQYPRYVSGSRKGVRSNQTYCHRLLRR